MPLAFRLGRWLAGRQWNRDPSRFTLTEVPASFLQGKGSNAQSRVVVVVVA